MTHYILITTKDRLNLLHSCLESIHKTTPTSKVFIVSDGSKSDTVEYITNSDYIEGYVINKTNIGIVPSIEIGLHLINNYHRFRFNEGIETDEDPWISYVQDDVEFIKDDWVNECIYTYATIMHTRKVAFITGHDAPEHRCTTIELLNKGTNTQLRNHIRATHMMTQLSFWLKQLPITVNGELGTPRGHPGNGVGADDDWYFLRGHPNSVLKLGMTNLVIPGLLIHKGSEQSTWQHNSTPEIK